MKSSEALGPRRRMAWKIVRRLIPRKLRWYYEGCPPLSGQLWYAERKLLYETVRRQRPRQCFEIGTWRGGGSTLFMAQALHDNGSGRLHTIETDGQLHQEAVNNYTALLPHLLPYVTFHLGNYRDIYGRILTDAVSVDLALLDGAENAEQTLAQYRFFLPHTAPGSLLLIHDWFTDKARLVRPHLEDTRQWKIEKLLTPPISVGFAIARRL